MQSDGHGNFDRHDPQSSHVPLHPRTAWMMCYNQTGSVQEVCRKFGISRKTFYKWLKRYKGANGDSSSLQDQSRRPHHFPNATPEPYITLLKRLREETGFGQRRLKIHLQEHYNINISERTIWKILRNSCSGQDRNESLTSRDLSFGKPIPPPTGPTNRDQALDNLQGSPF